MPYIMLYDYKHKNALGFGKIENIYETSCKNEEVEDDIWYTLTLNAGQPSDDGCEITAGTTWSSSDKIALINLSGTREITNLTNSGSTFTGTTLNLSNGYALGFLYPSDALTTAHSDTTTQVFYMSKQDGTPNTVLKYKYGYVSSVTPSGTNCSTSVTMNSVLAEADMKFLCNLTCDALDTAYCLYI